MIKAEVLKSLEEIKAAFSEANVTWSADGKGGAWFFIDVVDPGAIYSTRAVWLGADISPLGPQADVYPLFVGPALTRVDGGALGEGITLNHKFHEREAVQISLRSPHRNPAIETPLLKVIKVLSWLAKR